MFSPNELPSEIIIQTNKKTSTRSWKAPSLTFPLTVLSSLEVDLDHKLVLPDSECSKSGTMLSGACYS